MAIQNDARTTVDNVLLKMFGGDVSETLTAPLQRGQCFGVAVSIAQS
jgi:hypothetical protein